ncbi:MAG TPA: IS4 family transposase [Acidobacteriaceae bacterium]|nr:IS4 family transposase [Acidobacteriaceae bacterium]
MGVMFRVRAAADSINGLAVLFARFFGSDLCPARTGRGSRERNFGRVAVFWAFLGQVLTRGSSCRWAVERLQAEALARGRRRPDDSTSGYCQARAALSLAWLQVLFARLGQWFAPRVHNAWLGRTVRVIDGTGFSMPDTPANRQQWDYPAGTKPGCSFPAGKLVGLFCLHSGRLIAFVHDTWRTHDVKLARQLVCWLHRADVLIGDRAYCGWIFLALLRRRQADFVIRLHQARRIRSRRSGSTFEAWGRPQRPAEHSRRFWRALPKELPVRLVRFIVHPRGFRAHPVIVATSLLDQKAYPDAAIAKLYAQRWQVELHYRQIKTNLSLDILRGLSPCMIERELWMSAIAYNLIRALLLEAAMTHAVPIERLSFKGALDAVHAWTSSPLLRRARRRARTELLARIAADRVPIRPGRQEPRAIKRRHKNYQFLTRPRRRFRVSPSRSLK